MAWRTQYGDYVKFIRGTPAAWAAQEVKDPDTLYFISEVNATTGQLYLGQKLISGDSSSAITSLNDLTDVFISNNIPTDGVLVYNTTNHQWEAQSLQTILTTVIGVMTGATATANGSMGLVPQPLIADRNNYLKADGTWSNPVAGVNAALNRLIGNDTTGSIRDIAASEVAKLVANAPSNLDTLKEIADWIETHDSVIDAVDASARLEQLEEDMYGVENVTPGVLQDVEDLKTTVYGNNDDIIGLVPQVNNLETNFTTLNTAVSTLQTTTEAIDQKLKWQDLVYEN